jgi:hypothetical protein
MNFEVVVEVNDQRNVLATATIVSSSDVPYELIAAVLRGAADEIEESRGEVLHNR